MRVSGPDVPGIAATLLGRVPAARKAELRKFLAADGHAIDEGLALYFPAPASYTGEHLLELQGHGGRVVLDLLVRRLLELGCRAAAPGEFSERAFLNGKIDITQAEAIADLIDAGTSAAARAAIRSLQGEFSALVTSLQAQLTELRVYVEAGIDFPDEDVDSLPHADLSRRVARILESFDALLAAARQGTLLRDGFTVVIAGKPNAGKSSLMNRLAGDDVAIVAAEPGTTRDVLRREVQLEGMPLHLVDTAGLREAQDPVEAEGVRRARGEMHRADRILYVIDASAEAADAAAARLPPIAALPADIPATVVINKIDLLSPANRAALTATAAAAEACVLVSAATGEGLGQLRSHLQQSAGFRGGGEGALAARRRHLDALHRARALVTRADDVLRQTRAPELFAEELRVAQQHLGEITGEFSSDDLLGEVFGSFCIGK